MNEVTAAKKAGILKRF
jgi:hypothetical protein